jgi:hypothetical protein
MNHIRRFLQDWACDFFGHQPFFLHENGMDFVICSRCGSQWRLG